jgi:hypothetical protein
MAQGYAGQCMEFQHDRPRHATLAPAPRHQDQLDNRVVHLSGCVWNTDAVYAAES